MRYGGIGYDRFQTHGKLKKKTHGKLKKKRLGRKTPQDSGMIASSREPRRIRKQRRRHPVSILENASPSKPALADDHSKNEKSPQYSGRSSSGKASVDKPKLSEKVNKELSTSNVTYKHITSCALGGRAREPLFWLARGESSSDDESWDFDGPMLLPPPPL